MRDDHLRSIRTRAEWCRLKARECEALASAMTDRDTKLDMREVARKWLQLAEAEWLGAPAPEWAPLDRHLH